MRPLKQMNNFDRGELLCRLFPEELANTLDSIERQCKYFQKNENAFREGWQQKGFFTASFWYNLVQDTYKRINRQQKELSIRPRWFADQFFDGHNALFTVYCLIEYAAETGCSYKLRQAIHLFFGEEKLLQLTFKPINNNF
ncbi:MAG: hypothetical protein H3C48_11265 [Chitinophagaceae bacterium]|nr:hypothetical protein [Chitinophagaceae bacterium]